MGGRRRLTGGRSQSVVNRQILLSRIESCRQQCPTVDEIVDYLHQKHYGRTAKKSFARVVQETINRFALSWLRSDNRVKHSPSTSASFRTKRRAEVSDVDENDNGCTASRKKRSKKVDESELRLQRMEGSHIQRIRKTVEDDTSPSSSANSSSDEEEDDDDENGAVSTSEDAIYEEKMEPEFDLVKSMLRDSYMGSSKTTKAKPEDKNVELEVSMDNKIVKKLDMVIEPHGDKRRLGGNELKGEAKVLVDGVEVKKKKEGPKFKDLGGMKDVLELLMMEVIVPHYHPQLPRKLGVKPISGILLHGPPGCGKTKLAHAIANETGVPFYKISATELVSGVSGASEANIRELFSKAYKTAPSIVFIDEIDAIASKRENLQREMEIRVVTQLMSCMDEGSFELSSNTDSPDSKPGYVLVIGATNRPDAVDAALRRPGRFDLEIPLGVPDEKARIEILSVIIHDLALEGSFDLHKIARSTPGFVGADLTALASKAGNIAMKRIIDERKSEISRNIAGEERAEDWWKQPWMPEELDKLTITMADFEEAVENVQPSLRREGFSSIPDVKWQDVGGLDNISDQFKRYIVRHIKRPEVYKEFNLNLELGFLLYGPPGCGKTLIAKAVANEAGANFIHIKGPELLNKYVGESELAVRTLFTRARTCSPCILFFDEIDALTTTRGKEGGWVVERLLNQLLIELDGADKRHGVYVIGATNRIDVMDEALLRPGRFGKLLYVPLPSPEERGFILQALAKKKPVDPSVDLMAIGKMVACENLSGADLASLMNEAAMAALEEKLMSDYDSSEPGTIKTIHFEKALTRISPSVSQKQKLYHEAIHQKYSTQRGRNPNSTLPTQVQVVTNAII